MTLHDSVTLWAMLTFASWYQQEHWRGRPMRISNTAGRGRGLKKATFNWGVIPCLIPPWSLVKAYRGKQISATEYSSEYLRVLESRWDEVSTWLASLKPAEDLTLLCHEREGEFCHRKLVADVVRRERPDIEVRLH